MLLGSLSIYLTVYLPFYLDISTFIFILLSTRRVCKDGQDREGRMGMLLGSLYAGMAFANSPCAAVHALAYPIGKLSFYICFGKKASSYFLPKKGFDISLKKTQDRF